METGDEVRSHFRKGRVDVLICRSERIRLPSRLLLQQDEPPLPHVTFKRGTLEKGEGLRLEFEGPLLVVLRRNYSFKVDGPLLPRET